MRPKDEARGRALGRALVRFAANRHPLPGLSTEAHRDSFVEQIVESIRRVEYVHLIKRKVHDPLRADPTSGLFDPLLGAVVKKEAGEFDEACWLTFLSVHCGKHVRYKWHLARQLYGGLDGGIWTWARVSSNPAAYSRWIARNEGRIRIGGVYGFGNHRKYETLRPDAKRPTGAVVSSYVAWVVSHGNHEGLINHALAQSARDRHRAFDYLYTTIDAVFGFGRMAKFDYLTMLGKLNLADIEPGIAYLSGATGPLSGARLLFGGRANAGMSARQLDRLVVDLGAHLNVGMQVMEDAICNWQKSPAQFRGFRG